MFGQISAQNLSGTEKQELASLLGVNSNVDNLKKHILTVTYLYMSSNKSQDCLKADAGLQEFNLGQMIFDLLLKVPLSKELQIGCFTPVKDTLKLKLMCLLKYYSEELPAEEFYQLTEGSEIEQSERSHSSFIQDSSLAEKIVKVMYLLVKFY